MKVQLPLLLICASVFAVGVFASGADPSVQKRELNFNRDVKPILSEHCFKCHGPDAAVTAAGLRLDSFEGATKDREGRVGIVPKNLAKSLVWTRVSHENELLRMPPKDQGVKPLTPEQIDILKQWIEEGAIYEPHWSLVPPKKPRLPSVSDPKWIRNNIDRFVLAKLDQEELKPNPEADKATLIRRVALTLTGLPPTPQELRNFLSDKRPDAYERMVDRLLDSPQYGEHQARYWLDAVRYGDTHGLHLDNERNIYPYRDWLIRALNDDLPFDRFTIWQLAGDLLPNPTTQQLVATGFVRMNPTTNEGGAIEEEFLVKNTFDRVDTTSTVFLGMTVGCAKCHDHKYDPISQKDYYRLFAFFNSTTDKPLDGNLLLPEPTIRAATPEQEAEIHSYDGKLSALVDKVRTSEALEWLKAEWQPPVKTSGWQVSGPYQAKNFDEAYATSYAPETGKGDWREFKLELGKDIAGVVGKENAAAYLRGVVESPKARELGIRASSDDAIKIWVNGKLIHENKVLRGLTPILDQAKGEVKAGRNEVLIKIVNGGGPDGFHLRFGDDFADRLDTMHSLWTSGAPAQRKPKELAALYLEAGPENERAVTFRKLKKEKEEFESAIPQSLIAREMDKPREAYVLKRGEYNLRTDKVERALPEAFGTWPKKAPMNRLGFAQWLVSPDNPLVSRVFVNRVWQQHFGTGLVRTAEDFGSQGEWPINKQLLDYLAVEFREKGWSMKKLHRLLVTSAAFRQRSSVDAVKLEKDPENRLVSRGPRFRLDAEVIRDSALSVSGLLNDRIGGKGFKPYQPDGLWEAIAFLESTTARYVKDTSPEIYRRSLYLFWKRTSPHPVMLAFDAPMRESCTVRRSRTNTPLQALVTLNEPAFLESARTMAERVILNGRTDEERLKLAYELALSRLPTSAETSLLLQTVSRYRTRYELDILGAEQLLTIGDLQRDVSIPAGEHATWMLVCSTLMNTDEFLTLH